MGSDQSTARERNPESDDCHQKLMLKGKNHMLVVAIDFGTSYSGYAFQFLSDFKTDKKRILTPDDWRDMAGNRNYKTPTCLLLNENKEFDSFGFEAEDKYADLCLDETNANWYFFERFKMKLIEGKGLNKDSNLDDKTGKKMPALQIFSLSIKYLMKHMLKLLESRGTSVGMNDIYWVLTVPAIWNDAAKHFMRTAAIKAGILSENLAIALEPEAASILCQDLSVNSPFTVGTKYMVLDLGGGTTDITVHEKLYGGKLKEITKPSGGAWGGTAVDEAFIGLMTKLFGDPVMSDFIRNNMADYMDLVKAFEHLKRTFSADNKKHFNMKFPASLCKLYEDKTHIPMKDSLQRSNYSNQIKIISDKISLDAVLFRNLFQEVTDKIVNHVENLLKKTPGVSIIIMVGGFSSSKFVQDIIRRKFQDVNGLNVIVPEDAGLAILKGAVLFGRIPETMSSRVLRLTYGTKITPKFEPSKHPESKRVMYNETPHCQDVFELIIEADTQVERGHKVQATYSTLRSYQSAVSIDIYTSDVKPNFVTDPECELLGILKVTIPNPTMEKRDIDVDYVFGDTEIHVFAMERKSKQTFNATFEIKE